VHFRPLGLDDLPLLIKATVDNVNWDGTPRLSTEQVLADDRLSKYALGFIPGRDWGFAALESDKVIGVAWVQFFSEISPGYGFVDSETPELSINVDKGSRGKGVGSQLLEAILSNARELGCPSISLSVEDGNPARRLYEKFGFMPAGREGNSEKMIRKI
jgi:GNAT superfamily N-acetyltransferase